MSRTKVMARFGMVAVAVTALVLSGLVAPVSAKHRNQTSLVSLTQRGGQPRSGVTEGVEVSADGRYVAFESESPDLVLTDTNGLRDVFVRDTVSNTTTQVSVPHPGGNSNGTSWLEDMTPDGRFIVYTSSASNIDRAIPDTNEALDVFVYDTRLRSTARASAAVVNGTVIEGNGNSLDGSISDDGSRVAFTTLATNLAANHPPQGLINLPQVVVKGWAGATWSLVSVDETARPLLAGHHPEISGTGFAVAFTGIEHTGEGPARHMGLRVKWETVPGVPSSSGSQLLHRWYPANSYDDPEPAVSRNGLTVVFVTGDPLVSADGNGGADVYVASVSYWGLRQPSFELLTTQAQPRPGFEDEGIHQHPVVSADGNKVAYRATDGSGGSHIYRIDRTQPGTAPQIVDAAYSTGAPGNGDALAFAISAQGDHVAFNSVATDLVSVDANGKADTFLWDAVHCRQTEPTEGLVPSEPWWLPCLEIKIDPDSVGDWWKKFGF